MSNRLDRITTRTGDDGTTTLADGSRRLKSDARFEAMGNVDELNSHIGLLRAQLKESIRDRDQKLDEFLSQLQHYLFEIGSELAVPGVTFLPPDALQNLDIWSEQHNALLPPLKEFILPSGSMTATQAHICRTVVRRAERSMVALNQTEPLNLHCIQFLNRCSDVFFIMARVLNIKTQHTETYWQKT